jgi:hypothetical protein
MARGSLDKLVSLFPFILIILLFVIFWQYGSVNRCIGCLEVAGWNKVQPITATVSYKVEGTNPGTFKADFVNTQGFLIRITGISIADIVNGTPHACVIQTVKGVNESGVWVNGSFNESREWTVVSIKPRERFKVIAACPTKKSWESYDLRINMTHVTNLAGANSEYAEKGRITGPVKYYPGPRTGNESSP